MNARAVFLGSTALSRSRGDRHVLRDAPPRADGNRLAIAAVPIECRRSDGAFGMWMTLT